MSKYIDYWNRMFKESQGTRPCYDEWLEKYNYILDKSINDEIIDLGCGSGGDSFYLTKRGNEVIACDYSKEALSRVRELIPNINTIQMDFSKGLPFKDDSTTVIIADLSLHYFDEITTRFVLDEMRRVLKYSGYLIGRVNSINDVNYGAGRGEEIEKNFYLTESGYKRFFDREEIDRLFNKFKIKACEETTIKKYGSDKKAFEFVAIKD